VAGQRLSKCPTTIAGRIKTQVKISLGVDIAVVPRAEMLALQFVPSYSRKIAIQRVLLDAR
jgi:hypothetical protein